MYPQAPYSQDPYSTPPNPGRAVFVLAAIGAALAALYWGALTAVMAFGMSHGARVDPVQMIFPVILVVLYALRAVAVYNGDRNAAKRLMWLHGFGIAATIFQLTQISGMQGAGILTVLYGFKIVVHVLGGVPAYLAQREP